jgi:hypothetical protein
MQHPQAASAATKDEMLPLHLVVGANSDPTHEHANHGSAEEPNDGERCVHRCTRRSM